MIFIDGIKSIDTGFRWQTFNGTELKLGLNAFSRLQLISLVVKKSNVALLSYLNENNDGWVNGEDLKFEYVYFNTNKIIGTKKGFPIKGAL